MSWTPEVDRNAWAGARPFEQRGAFLPKVGLDSAAVAAAVRRLLRTDDAHAALGFLNARTRFRFTALCPVESDAPRAGLLFDRENPTLRLATAADPSHIALSCAAVPLRARSGRARGTLCHYDFRPRLLQAREREVLEAVGLVLVAWLEERQRRA